MLITIQQTKSNFENLFEVSSNGQILFNAGAPWFNVSLPFNAENVRKLTFSTPAGEILYTTNYKVIANAVEESIPFKYLVTKEQRFAQFEIVGKNGSEGTFYILQTGMFDKKFCIEHMGKVYLGYSLDHGRNNIVSIYEGDKQIAQITKPLTVIDNLDSYYLHIKDECTSMIPVLSFFTIYYDYRKYNNSGKIVKNSIEISTSYSYSKNNSKYNPDWIAQEFGQEAANEFQQIITQISEQGNVQAKMILKILGIIFLAVILLIVILFIVLINLLG